MSNHFAVQPKRGGFEPGVSGNPGGRPRTAGFAAKVRQATADGVELIDFLLATMRDDKASRSTRLQACEMLLDRMLGKATEHVDVTTASASVTVQANYSALTLEEKRHLLELMRKARGLPGDEGRVSPQPALEAQDVEPRPVETSATPEELQP